MGLGLLSVERRLAQKLVAFFLAAIARPAPPVRASFEEVEEEGEVRLGRALKAGRGVFAMPIHYDRHGVPDKAS